ncbi:MAG: hypothetical protein ACOZCO_01580 [Bacteroidota bacterium]
MKRFLFFMLMPAVILTSREAKSQCESEILDSYGAVSSMYLYNTYIVIGSVGDGFEKGVYDAAYTKLIMNEQISAADNIISGYKAVLATGTITREDSVTLKEMADCCELLKAEATALNVYADDSSAINGDKFQEKRKAAWAKIAEILGFENE